MESRFGANRFGNGLDGRHQVRCIQASIRSIGRPDAQKRNIGFRHSLHRRRRSRYEPRLKAIAHDFINIPFDNRRETGGNTFYFTFIDIATDDPMTKLSEACDSNTPHIPQPKDANRCHNTNSLKTTPPYPCRYWSLQSQSS